ncbi:hypothetical protein [Planctomycetes bacterium TBK1r]|uniref:Uncharacterized protein n=1 Tax=Stieleria magnilauensis TaxID=2527963 RepID=A0ABX5XUS4_9BACT|nr:hypothetical protein TBK1r_47990 [Planctomycetes bacterium TBK1r]
MLVIKSPFVLPTDRPRLDLEDTDPNRQDQCQDSRIDILRLEISSQWDECEKQARHVEAKRRLAQLGTLLFDRSEAC